MHILSDWITNGELSELCTLMSSILVLPLLTIIQVGQYFHFLELKNLSHHEFIAQVREGGVQGYCGGLLPAAAIACSKDENDVVMNASKAVRLALCIGAYAELGDDEADIGPTSMVVRLKAEGQGEEIVRKFPHVSDNLPCEDRFQILAYSVLRLIFPPLQIREPSVSLGQLLYLPNSSCMSRNLACPPR